MIGSIEGQKFLIFVNSYLSILLLLLLVSYVRNHFLNEDCKGLFLCVQRVLFLALTFRFITHVELIFAYVVE